MRRAFKEFERRARCWVERRRAAGDTRAERGDTLVEVLLAIAVLGIAGVALMTAFATSITASGQHRNLASLDASVRLAANSAIADIQQQAGQSNNPFTCQNNLPNFTPTFTNLTGPYQVTYTVQWWTTTNGTGSWTSTCTPSAPQQYVLTISSTKAPLSTTVTTVITDPGAPLPPNGIGTPYQLVFLQQGTMQGSAFSPFTPQPEVAVEDNQGDIVSSAFSSVTLQVVTGPSGGSISNTCTGVPSFGIVQFSDCSMNVAGAYTIQATNSSLQPTEIDPVSITAAAPAKIAFITAPVSGTPGTTATLGPLTVQQQDAFGNPVATTSAVTVNVSSSSTGGIFATTSGGAHVTSVTIPANSSTATTSFYYGDSKSGTPTLTAASAGLTSGTQTENIVTTPTQLAITSPVFTAATSSSAATPFTVTLEDSSGNPTSRSAATTINLTSTSTGRSFAVTSGGAAVTSVTLPANTSSMTVYYGDSKVGTPTITVSSTSPTTLTSGTQKENIVAGPTKLVLTGPTSGTASGLATIGPFTVTEENAQGTPTIAGETVNLSSSSGGSYVFGTNGTVSPTGASTVTIPSGQSSATFYYGDTTASTSTTLTASVTGLTSGTSQVRITAGTGAQLAITSNAFTGTSNSKATNAFTVTLQDAFGNTTTSTNATLVGLTSNSSGTAVFATTSGGTATTSVIIPANTSSVTAYYGDTMAGTPTLTASGTGLTVGTQQETITGGTGTKLAITSTAFTGAANAKATNAFQVTLEDAFGNATTKTTATTINLSSNSTGTHAFSATSGGSNTTTVTLAANSSSVGAFYGDEFPGTPTITVASAGLTSATQQETITAGAPSVLVFTSNQFSGGASTSATLGPITVQEQDAYGNVASVGSPTTVNLTSSSAGATFAASSGGTSTTSVTIPGGSSVATFFYGDTVAGHPTITAAASGLTSATQSETITALGGTQLGVSTFSGPATATATNAFTVKFEDVFGNAAVATTAIPVTLSSNSTGTKEFAATSGGASTTTVQIAANQSSVTAYYGDTKAGTPTITATSAGLTTGSQQETITGGVPHTIAISSGSTQSATVNTAFGSPLVALVTDSFGNAVSGATVTFTAPASSGASGTFLAASNGGTCLSTGGTAVASCTATTNGAGTATSLTFTADTHAGTYNVAATSTGTTPNPLNFSETNTAATTNDNMTITGGNNQSATVGTAYSTGLTVNIVDSYNNPVSGMNVTFTAPASGASGTFGTCSGGNNGSFTTCVVATNASGNATASTFTANHTAGAVSVATSASGDTTPPTFSETNTAGLSHTIAISSGSAQSATVSTSFTNPLVALVTDSYGNPVSGATVTFTAPASSGASGTFLAASNGGTCLSTGGTAVASCTATTSASGLATSLTFKADTHAGTYNVAATSTGTTPNPLNFSETNTAATTNDNMTITAGNNQSAMVGSAYTTALGVNIVDSFNNPVSGMTVTFTSPGTGASGTFGACPGGNNATFTTCVVTTDVNGNASASTFTANHTAGAVSVATSASGDTTPPTFSETNTAGLSHTIAISSGSAQSATVSTSFTNPLVALVTDSYGNPVSGATVTFTAPASSGASGTFLAASNGGTCLSTGGTAVASCTATTSASGLATSLTFKADTHAGTYNVAATSTGTTPNPLNFSETNTAATTNDNMTITAGNNQSAMVGSAYTTALGVNIVDSFNNPVSGMTVTFTSPGTGASGTFGACPGGNNATFTTCVVTTDVNGNASASTFTANHTAGAVSVTPSATGDTTPPTFSETNTAGLPHTIAISSGSTQSATVNTAFGSPLVALVTDSFGNAVSGATVTFTAPASSGASGTFLAASNGGTCLSTGGTAVASCTATTNGAGTATSLTFTADTHAGTYNVAATSTGTTPNPLNFSETNTAATTNDNMTITGGNNQSATVGTAYSTGLTVNIVDSYNNPVSGMNVTFTAPASGASGTFGTCSGGNNGSFTTCVVATNASGNATASTFTANHTAGAVSVATSASGDTTPPTFSETNTADTTNDNMTITGGNNQSATVGTAYSTGLTVNIVDSYNNPVSGMNVTFTAPASGASGTFGTCSGGNNGSFTTCVVATNASGNATASTFTANHTAGAVSVATSASGDTTPPTFSETNTAGLSHTIAISSGSAQSATVSTSFTNPLVALVTDSYGNPVSGATVTFTAPASSGASGTFLAASNGGTCLSTGGTAVASCTATTSASGLATSLTFKADTHAGTYNVAATSTGTTPNPLNFSETNLLAVTVTNAASQTATGTTVTSSNFTMTSGATYVVAVFERASGNAGTPTLTITGNPTTSAVITNNFGGTSSPNCNSTRCYVDAWSFNANTSGTGSVKVTQAQAQNLIVDVLALSGNNTTTPIAQSDNSQSGQGGTVTANLNNAPAAGNTSLDIIGADNTIGTVNWSAGSTSLFNSSGTSASLGVYVTTPAAQTNTASSSGFGSHQDWATIPLEINHG